MLIRNRVIRLEQQLRRGAAGHGQATDVLRVRLQWLEGAHVQLFDGICTHVPLMLASLQAA